MADQAAPIHIGTSGWIYRHWRSIFYPSGLTQKKWLEFYVQHFDTVEVNFTFYRLPESRVFQSWQERAPAGFCFALKGSQYVTHMKRLAEPHEHIQLFFERARPLEASTGPILWQLPPRFARNDERLDTFLAALPTQYRHAVEFRHPSWLTEDVYTILRQHHAAFCVADSVRRPGEIVTTSDWTYIRFHEGSLGGDYTDEQLRVWAGRIHDLRMAGIESWIYFNNDPQGFAIKNALDLRSRLHV